MVEAGVGLAVPVRGQIIALAVTLQESVVAVAVQEFGLFPYANSTVAASLGLRHERAAG